jgi:flavin reductase (DIM6/NTAB) family NADH-FMN oxidoreductase RutF
MTPIAPGPGAERPFRDALGRYATGVTLVTADSEIGPLGITANSFSSLSLDPPLVLWSPARASRRFEAFAGVRHFAIHVLRADQEEIARRFAHHGTDFTGLKVTLSARRVPLLGDALARFECEFEALHDAGDHAIIVGRVGQAHIGKGEPLIFAGGRYRTLSGE